ncbi:hypothetical protein LAN32_26845, partial [Mycobacterium tuberculosis]|nr:hypothetical protein [Mycobacterium tuberculosis]
AGSLQAATWPLLAVAFCWALPGAIILFCTARAADVALLARVAAEPRFKSLIFTPRGGGTGTNGQALNGGIIVDMSRY